MKIVADENIPLVKELFGSSGEVSLIPGRSIQPHDVKAADILLVRSMTPVDKNLLVGSQVKFVGTATAGIEHIDTNYLKKAGIIFANAAGSNANAVAEYVICCVANLLQQKLLPANAHVGVIGVGKVGSKVVNKLSLLGFTVLQNDPPRAEKDTAFVSVPLSEFSALDLICLHTPLTKSSLHPTFHLIDKRFLENSKQNVILLNAGRGGVIDSRDLFAFGQHAIWCLDVWEHEPNIDLNILKRTKLATPHIAGYTMEAKLQGAFMLYQAAQQALKLPEATVPLPNIEFELIPSTAFWHEVVLQIYNPEADTQAMRAALLNAPQKIAENFDNLRKHYPKRHEFSSITLKNAENIKEIDKAILQELGFKF